ncbi:tyrosine protein-kinase src-2-like [Homarus americanus]|uniref:tyrosine protein-kinase src-2-like n=1 Tax=Homarus americanus TaxID=6706 RepID=UPI001C45C721|nr:tyrosine protein-kinase src-2-like [Homarus americanus]
MKHTTESVIKVEWSKTLKRFSRSQVKHLVSIGVLLGEGNYGSVFKISGLLGQNAPPLILKVSKKEFFSNDLKDEAHFLHLLDCAGGAPKLLAYSQDPPTIMTTYAGDQTLRKLLQNSDHGLSNSQLLEIAIGIGERLMEIHLLDVVHNDLHWENVLVTLPTADQDLQLSLIDYGLAKMAGENLHLQSGTAVNQVWMCPQVRDGVCSTFKSDVYSYGIILTQILDQLTCDIFQELADLIDAACEYESCDRPPLRALLQRLECTLEDVRLRGV